MARDFVKTGVDTLYFGINSLGPLINGKAKISVHAHVKPDTFGGAATDNRVLNIINNGSNTTGLTIAFLAGPPAKLRIGARSGSADGFQSIDGATTVTTGVRHSVGGVVEFDTDNIRVYLDGIQDASGAVVFGNTTYVQGTPTDGYDAIGAEIAPGTPTAASSADRQFDGPINELTIWDGDIGTSNFQLLNQGYSGIFIQRDKILLHIRLKGDSPEVAIIGGVNGTVTGSLAYIADVTPYYLGFLNPKMKIHKLWVPLAAGLIFATPVPKGYTAPIAVKRVTPFGVHNSGYRPLTILKRTKSFKTPFVFSVPKPETGNMLLAPLNLEESLGDHFLSRGWTSAQDQINAGYPIVGQPVPQFGTYEEIFDWGAVFNNVIVNVDWASAAITGTVSITCQLSHSLDNITYSTPVTTTSMFIQSFRYLKMKITFEAVN